MTKPDQQVRIECLRLAVTTLIAKAQQNPEAEKVLRYARQYYYWTLGEEKTSARDMTD